MEWIHSFEHGMFVRQGGRGPGRAPVLWIHGLGESGLCFEAIAGHPHLRGRRHVIPDLPGYGRSPHPLSPLGFAHVADHLEDWLASRETGPVVLVGHSLGGVLGLVLAERHPARIAAFVNVDGNVCEKDCTYSGPIAALSRAAFLGGGFDAFRETILKAAPRSPAFAGYYASLRFADPRCIHAHSRELVRVSRIERIAARMRRLACPVLYVAGRPGGVSTASLRILAREEVPFQCVEPAGHWPFLDRPDDFAGRLRTFLRGLGKV